MAKVKGPILSLDARGSIAKSQVYSNWRGIQYARHHVIPSNPQSTEQTKTRTAFAALQELYKRMGTKAVGPWEAGVSGQPLTARNLLTKKNLPLVRGQADMQDFIGSPGARGGLGPTSIAAVGGGLSGEIDVTVGAPLEASGWTLDSIEAMAFVDRDPAALPSDWPQEGSDDAPTGGADSSITISGLKANTLCVVVAWTKWTRPDGKTAYGPSLTTTATSTA